MATAAYGGASAIHAARLAARAKPLAPSPATAALEVLVAGRPIDRSLAARTIGDLDAMIELGLIEARGDRVIGRARVVPHAGLLLVCPPGQLPDDSSLHLRGALPDRCDGRWLDVGTGCGLAPLSRPRLGAERLGTDIDEAAIAGARLGAGLSGIAGPARFAVADLFEGVAGRFALITFNAPLPLPAGLLDRFWAEAARRLAPGGEVLVHAAGQVPELEGQVTGLRYTPGSAPVPFAVIRWRPDAPVSRRVEPVELTARQPHISRAMFDR